MKRIAIISLLTLSISLTGCSSILKKLLSSDGSGVKFEEKGQKMDRNDWNDNFKKAVEDSNFESDNVPAFVISASSSSKQNNDESNGDYKVSEESSYSYKETYKYDDGKMLLSYVRSGTSNSTASFSDSTVGGVRSTDAASQTIVVPRIDLYAVPLAQDV